jgi:drug/metabolite transporter (DMT)-like permease
MTPNNPAQTTSRPHASIWIALGLVYVLWGSTYLGIRVAVETIPPFLMAAGRFAIAGAVLVALRLPSAIRAGSLPTGSQWGRALVIGAALLLGGNGLVCWAEQVVPSGMTALVVALVPIWMAILDRIFFGRRMGALAVLGLLMGFGGVALLVGPLGGGHVAVAGAIALAIATLSWAAGSLYSRHATVHDDSLLATGMEMVLGGASLALAAAFAGDYGRLHFAAISPASWIAFAYLVVFGGIVGFGAYLWLLRNAPTGLVSTYAYVNPVVAVFLGWTFLREPIGGWTIAAGALILASVAFIGSSRKPADAPARAPAAAATPRSRGAVCQESSSS